jgi:putative transposase
LVGLSEVLPGKTDAERLLRTIKEEVDLAEYQDYWDAYHQIGSFLETVYMRKRIHSTLEYLTPQEFEFRWLGPQIEALGFS